MNSWIHREGINRAIIDGRIDVAQYKKELYEMGKRARKVAESYDQPFLVDKLCEVFHYIENNRF